jgi:hypothetical protein
MRPAIGAAQRVEHYAFAAASERLLAEDLEALAHDADSWDRDRRQFVPTPLVDLTEGRLPLLNSGKVELLDHDGDADNEPHRAAVGHRPRAARHKVLRQSSGSRFPNL